MDNSKNIVINKRCGYDYAAKIEVGEMIFGGCIIPSQYYHTHMWWNLHQFYFLYKMSNILYVS